MNARSRVWSETRTNLSCALAGLSLERRLQAIPSPVEALPWSRSTRMMPSFNTIQIKHILLKTLGSVSEAHLFSLSWILCLFQTGLAMTQMTLAGNRHFAESLIAALIGCLPQDCGNFSFPRVAAELVAQASDGCLRQRALNILSNVTRLKI